METLAIKTAADLGKAVRRARTSEHLTQRQLALSVGTGERFIVDLEAGKETARLGPALRVATALGLKLTAAYEADG
jgi:y4mF family transcriptional regulator